MDEPQRVDPAQLPGTGRAALARVLESAAHLQALVPDAVLVGDTAAALWADHRDSLDHDHVVGDLQERFDEVLDAIEATHGWVTNRVVPGKLILRELGGIESGVRQLIRTRPLELIQARLPNGDLIRIPTLDETLRVKGFLVVRRNQTRDYLDVAALSERCGTAHAGAVLGEIDNYYADQRPAGAEGVATQLARQLADPRPADSATPAQLAHYKGVSARWADWHSVVEACRSVAAAMVSGQ